MPPPVDVVRELFEARRAGDRIKMNALCSEMFAFTFNADPERVGTGTTVIGWDAVNAHLDRVKAHWEQIGGGITHLVADADNPEQVNVQLAFKLRHRASGEFLEGVKRQEWIVRQGTAVSATEIFDQNTLHAFQRMAEASARGQLAN